MASSPTSIVIIGAGVIGSAVGLSAARRGWDVTLIDRETQPGHGSTSASAGIIRLHATDTPSATLAAAALPFWHHWSEYLRAGADETLASFRECGSLILDDGGDFIGRCVDALAATGAVHERLTRDQLREVAPFMDLGRFGPPKPLSDDGFWSEPDRDLAGALHTPASGYVADPGLAARNLFDAAVRAGARARMGRSVRAITVRRDKAGGVELDDGQRIDADVVINAAGPSSHTINALARVGDDFTVRTCRLREELHHVPCPDGLNFEQDGFHIVDPDLGINFRPEVGNAILVGSNGAASDPITPVDDVDTFDGGVSAAAWNRQVLRLCRRIPAMGMPNQPSGIAGIYDATEDWRPIYDRTALPGYYVAMGTSGNQFKTAPLVGEFMCRMVDGVASGVDVDEVGISFVTDSGHKIRSRWFSRLREPTTNGARG